MRFKILIVIVLSFFIRLGSASADGPGVEFFTPQGAVKGVRQVSVRFSEQMVSFGDPFLREPFDIKCPEKGNGRWMDGKNWMYDFDRDLPASVVCEFNLKPGIKTLSNKELTGQKIFNFSTGGPSIIRSEPYGGSDISEDQVFILKLDAEPVEESVLSNMWCSIEGINERVGIRILKDKEREEILKVRYEKWTDPSSFIVIQCRQNFPNDKVVRLIWGAGIKTASGGAITEDQTLNFTSRRPFEVRSSCERENEKADCIPILPIHIRFSSYVPVSIASRIILISHAKTYLPAPFEEKREYVNTVVFPGPFPENATLFIEIPPDITDDAGRPLANVDSSPFTVRTGSYPPLAKFSAKFGIIEKDEPVLPVTLRNVEVRAKSRMLELPSDTDNKDLISKAKEIFGRLTGRIGKIESDKEIIDWYFKVHSADREESILTRNARAKAFDLPGPKEEKDFEVIGIPLKKTGFYVVEIESLLLGKALLGKPAPMYVQTSALVTNLSAHFKWGKESSLVWVTTLNKAEPVEDSLVTIRNCKGEKLWEGKTDGQGIAMIKEELPSPECNFHDGLFVFAKTGDDMTFVYSKWDDGIEPWRFQLPRGEEYAGPVIAHTILDRSLFRAGETVHMKHIIRKHSGAGFSFLKSVELPRAVVISHWGSNQSYQFPLNWDVANGIAETTWKIPEEARLGSYQVILLKDLKNKAVNIFSEGDEGDEIEGGYWHSRDSWTSGFFRVEEFKIPFMKGTIQPLSEQLINSDEADVDLMVSYLSGGGAVDLPVRLRSQGRRHYVYFKDYEEFSFANGIVKEGIIKDVQQEGESEVKGKNIQTTELVLGSGGSVRTKITGIPKEDFPQEILTELEFKDPSGLIQTVSRTIHVWPSGIVLGIKTDSWVSTPESLKFHILALDLSGKPIPDVDIRVDLYKNSRYTHRKRLIGGFYSYESLEEARKIGLLCEGRTDTNGRLICEVRSPVSGEVILQASSRDSAGNLSSTNASVWVKGNEEWWFDISDSDRIDVLPESKKYEPGETARFQVRMPFREATALITVEREGILDTYIRKISGQNPTVDIPVKGNYAPNVFVSVLCVRGRAGESQPTALVDLGKPAFKLGISEINVGWKDHELRVKVTADRDMYKTRETAKVHIRVSKADGSPLNDKSEIAIAAVDEGLLELWANRSWNLLDEMMQRRGYEVQTSTAQMEVVGKRHYGLKALPPGGGGGKKSTRELFDTLLIWRGRIELDSSGEVFIDVPLNDSLTSFRIVAVASSGAGFFGTGETTVHTSQDLVLMSELPSVVREGDIFRAGFTVRNATNRGMDVELKSKITESGHARELEPLMVKLGPGEAKEEGWELKVPPGIETMGWEVSAGEINGVASDAFKVSQKVKTAFPVSVFQATLLQLDHSLEMKVEKPMDAIPGKGELRVSLRPRLSDELSGVMDYMKRYSYTCMEQTVSKAIALRDEGMWKAEMKKLPSYLDSDGFVKYFCQANLEMSCFYQNRNVRFS